MKVLGADPGGQGGLAIIQDGKLITGIRMPVIEIRGKKILNARAVLEWWGTDAKPFDAAVVEAVHAMPNQGVSSSFQFLSRHAASRATAGDGLPSVAPSRTVEHKM
jgi:hypothetical protein